MVMNTVTILNVNLLFQSRNTTVMYLKQKCVV